MACFFTTFAFQSQASPKKNLVTILYFHSFLCETSWTTLPDRGSRLCGSFRRIFFQKDFFPELEPRRTQKLKFLCRSWPKNKNITHTPSVQMQVSFFYRSLCINYSSFGRVQNSLFLEILSHHFLFVLSFTHKRPMFRE